MNDSLILYVLAGCGTAIIGGLIFFFAEQYRRKRADYRKDLEKVRHVSAPVRNPASVPSPLRLGRTEVHTDCMAKTLVVSVDGNPGWRAEAEGEVTWLRVVKVSECRLMLHLLTNFALAAREAGVLVFYPDQETAGAGETARIAVSQCESGYYPELTLSETFYIRPGDSMSLESPLVSPGPRCDEWYVKSLRTNDEGGWCEVEPAVGERCRGARNLLVRTYPKPAHVAVRNALVTVGCGTFPFQTLRTLVVSQGIVFDYYIEYPAFDACGRRQEVIEVPPACAGDDKERIYKVYVRSNLPWRLVDGLPGWVSAGPLVMDKEERYNGYFTVTVRPNDERTRVKGVCAARYATLRMVTELGQVHDIRIYQGGYVVIRGRRWLDRNLLESRCLTDNAVPCGLDMEQADADSRIYGGLFQFGQSEPGWDSSSETTEDAWNLNTDEHPVCHEEADPSPAGWRVPSSLELESLFQARNSVPTYAGKGWVELVSDDGVPVFFPLSGYLCHINGYRMARGVEAGYWSSSERTRIYADAVILMRGRLWHFPRQLKKQGFSIRSIEDVTS